MRVQGTWLSGSKSRCSISSKEVVLLKGDKKSKPKRPGSFFKSIGKVLIKIVEVILALGTIAELALVILKWLGW